jgi:peptidoglycan/LPS O-acetylase OafA/YrhL
MELSLSKKKDMLDSLTAFRFIAALLVFIFHGGIWSKYQTGYLGVTFFFILSGFILAYNYRGKLDIQHSEGIKVFYAARIAKIFPVHLLTFFFAIPYYFFIPLEHETVLYVLQAITNISLIHGFIPFGNVSFNGVSWSLSAEMFFYSFFPFLLIFLTRYKIGIKSKLIIICLLWLASILMIMVFFQENNSLNTWFTYFFPVIRSVEFTVGVILGLIFIDIKSKFIKIPGFIFSIMEILSLFIILFVVINSLYFMQNIRFSLIFVPFLSLLIITFAFQKGVVSKLLSNRILVYLGEISFSFYMVHNLVLSYILFLWKPNINTSILLLVCLIISLIMSSFLYHLYEEPVRKRVKVFLSAKTLPKLSKYRKAV